MSTRELQYTPHRSSARSAIIRIFFANASRYQGLPDGSGYHCWLTLRVTMIVSGRRPLNGNPTCQRGSYITRPISHPPGQPSRIFFANASRYQVLPYGSGYHCWLTLRVTMIVSGRRPLNGNPTCQRGSYSTRPIAHPHGQPSSGSSSLTLRVTKASLTVRVTIAG